MITAYKTILVLVLLAASSATVLAAEQSEQDRADRATYRRLIRELRRDHAALARTYSQAVREARENEGSAAPQTKVQVLSLRDRIDRKSTRMMMIALRHGWDVPEFSFAEAEHGDGVAAATETAARAEVFAPVDQMILTSLAAEARQIAADLALPVISLAKEG